MKRISTFILLCTFTPLLYAQDFDPAFMKQQEIMWHKQNYVQHINDTPEKSSGKSAKKTLAGQIDRVEHNCELKFLSGANVAWNNYANDLGPGNYDPVFFQNMFQEIEAAGGNIIRLWIHTNGVNHPQFTHADPFRCTGMEQAQIDDLVEIVDSAWAHGIAVQPCIWSHNMLQDGQFMLTQAIRDRNRAMLENPVYTQHYIDNALLPMVNALQGHPGLFAWEVFNEPEGMCNGLPHSPFVGWTFERTEMHHIQRFVNQIAGAIHRADTTAKVTNGAWDVESTTDVDGHVNYYRDDSLIARGGDLDGYLDFYEVHYYDWAGAVHSPFHNDVDYWGLDKELIVAEFYAQNTFGVVRDSLFKELYDRGYAGGFGWMYNGNWNGSIEPSIQVLSGFHASDIDFDLLACNNSSAAFTANKTDICPGDTVVFTDNSVGAIINWTWDFGTGATPPTASGIGPHSVVYGSSGTPDVQLTTQTGTGSDIELKTDYITVNTIGTDEVILTIDDSTNCGGPNLSADFNPVLPVEVDSAGFTGLSGWTPGIIVNQYTVSNDGSINPSDMNDLGQYIYGSWQAAKGMWVEFDVNFRVPGTAYVDVLGVSATGTKIMEILIDGVSEATMPFTGPGLMTINVPAGTHTIRYNAGQGQDWLEIGSYGFAGLKTVPEYQWFINSVPQAGDTLSNFAPGVLNDGDELKVEAWHSSMQCISSPVSSSTVTMTCLPTGIAEKSLQLAVYPNPVSDQLHIQAKGDFQYNLKDIRGVELLSGSDSNQADINTSNLTIGVYVLQINQEGQIVEYKILRQ